MPKSLKNSGFATTDDTNRSTTDALHEAFRARNPNCHDAPPIRSEFDVDTRGDDHVSTEPGCPADTPHRQACHFDLDSLPAAGLAALS